jgi:hypothetical protein
MRKRCTKCGKNRLTKFFYVDRRLSGHLKSQCTVCSKAYSAKWKKTNRGKNYWRRWAKARRFRMYNITEAQYIRLLRKQRGKCAVCERKLGTKRQPHIDHDHTTKKTRGILCSNCNTLLGLAKERIRTLLRAIKYLRRTS